MCVLEILGGLVRISMCFSLRDFVGKEDIWIIELKVVKFECRLYFENGNERGG